MSNLEVVDILLVEDSEADAEMTIRALSKHNLGNKLTWVRDGVEAIDFIYCRGSYSQRSNGHSKLILLDIKMPKMGGIEVLQQLKSDENTRKIPVVILTSSAEGTDVTEAY
ncbi:two-component system response regulator [Undibacterium sp. GrIS 1.8]|uniref:response regulator n=1 Tax=Undibacterium sp. GrIS 1.8 TaxID=3143934 RepID=UPI003391F922